MELRMPAARLFAVVTLVVAALVLAVPGRASDINGFLPEQGHVDVALSYTSETYDHFWVGTTKVADPGVGKVDIKSTSLWLQWGLTPDLALVANLPYVDTSGNGLGHFKDSGVQDLSALLKYRFFSAGPSRLVAGLGVRTPATSYEGNLPVTRGHHTTDFLFRLVYQYQTEYFYFSQQLGYDLRNKDAPNSFPLYTELGFTAGPVTYTGFYSRLIGNDGTDIGDPGFTFPSNRQEYSRIGARAYGRVTDRFGLSAAYYTTLDGRNVGDSHGFSGGLVFRF
ncbi:MAG: hypothetical protein QOF89_5366 [Acidobacteriota bacterium]|jgi:hypothetical protein|nr:hypothetical protein [Acidobacteriota bacterium]